jgi:hypothetical protein
MRSGEITFSLGERILPVVLLNSRRRYPPCLRRGWWDATQAAFQTDSKYNYMLDQPP